MYCLADTDTVLKMNQTHSSSNTHLAHIDDMVGENLETHSHFIRSAKDFKLST